MDVSIAVVRTGQLLFPLKAFVSVEQKGQMMDNLSALVALLHG